jgi:Tfp pilus assembly protein PilO
MLKNELPFWGRAFVFLMQEIGRFFQKITDKWFNSISMFILIGFGFICFCCGYLVNFNQNIDNDGLLRNCQNTGRICWIKQQEYKNNLEKCQGHLKNNNNTKITIERIVNFKNIEISKKKRF